jgi:pimeloyl-ACP methyl ester carboxylesterase
VTLEELEHFAVITEALKDFDITGELDKISCPVLVLGSKDDRVFGEAASGQIAAGLRNSPDCQLYMYDEYGHVVYDLAPDYRERMLRFLV